MHHDITPDTRDGRPLSTGLQQTCQPGKVGKAGSGAVGLRVDLKPCFGNPQITRSGCVVLTAFACSILLSRRILPNHRIKSLRPCRECRVVDHQTPPLWPDKSIVTAPFVASASVTKLKSKHFWIDCCRAEL